MQTYKNEIKVYRGETFTVDKILQNRDGTPYIISSALQNPYILISVSNTQYAQENRYVKNYWLSLENFPRFESTHVFDIKELKLGADSEDVAYDTFEELSEDALENFEEIGQAIVQGYLNGKYVSIDLAGFAVLTDGTSYKYWDADSKSLVDYECRIVKTFSSDDTREWIAQNYLYSIQLVYGTSTLEYLTEQVLSFMPDFDNTDITVELLYRLLVVRGYEFPTNFEVTQPLLAMSGIPILQPTAIKVIDYTQGEITW